MNTLLLLGQASREVSPIPLYVIIGYMGVLLAMGYLSSRSFRGTSADFFTASRSIGPVLLLMSIFGTTMTSFAMIGSTAKSFDLGIGVYGLMASWSGLIHSAIFFLVGIKLWALGKRYGYMTQVQFFRDRYQSNLLGYILFPVLVALVIPYILIGLLGAGAVVRAVTMNMFPEMFASTQGAVPQWLTGLIISLVVLYYIFVGGVRGATWANTFQTLVFMVTGVVAFLLIAKGMGGLTKAGEIVAQHAPENLAREGRITHTQFLTYMFVPLSVGMFPHLFQHWLTAKSAKTFRLTVVAHPIFIMIVWAPCILIGIWAAGLFGQGALVLPAAPPMSGMVATVDNPEVPGERLTVRTKADGTPLQDDQGKLIPAKPSSNAVLGRMVDQLVHSPLLTGVLIAGVLAAIMSSLDSQFVCLGTMFTTDIVIHMSRKDRFTDKQKLLISRSFIVGIVGITYLLSLAEPRHVFDLGVWCFSGFGALFPLVFAAIYWRRVTRAGALACVLMTGAAWTMFFLDDIVLRGHSYFGTVDPGTDEYLVLGVMPAAVIFAVSALTLVGVSLATTPPPKEHVDRFFLPAE